MAFKFVRQLRDHVLLIDEVDYCLPSSTEESGVTTHASDQAVIQAFRTEFEKFKDIAAKQNLIFVSTSNHPEKMDAPTKRRLTHERGATTIDYFKSKEDLDNLASVVIDRYAPNEQHGFPGDPSYEIFGSLKRHYADALLREAERGLFYSNDEVNNLFSAWVTWNRDEVSPLGEEYMWDPRTLAFMVRNSKRTTNNKAGFAPVYPPADFVKSQGQIEKTPQGPPPGTVRMPGFHEMAEEPPPVATRPGAQSPAVPKGPLAHDVDLEDRHRQAEEYLLRPAPDQPPRNAGSATKPKTASKKKITLVSIAENVVEQSYGLKHVHHMPEMTGMLFKYESPRVLSFWMQDTYLPLDIAFIDPDGMVVKTERMVPLSLRSVTSGKPCVMALEVPVGTLEQAGGLVGKKLLLDRESNTVVFDD
jgi:hypothetical protein